MEEKQPTLSGFCIYIQYDGLTPDGKASLDVL